MSMTPEKPNHHAGTGGSSRRRFLASILLGSILLPCAARLTAQQSGPKVVELTAGVCPVVAHGEILVFDFQPQFDTSAAQGLKNLSLVFHAESVAGQHQANDFTLHAIGRENAESTASIQPLGGGHFRFRFHINPSFIEPGTYHLNRIEADAIVREDYKGEPPQLINSPHRSTYCLVVTRSTR